MFAIDVNEWRLPNLLQEKRQSRLEKIEHSRNGRRPPRAAVRRAS